jgi:hypothetical protein
MLIHTRRLGLPARASLLTAAAAVALSLLPALRLNAQSSQRDARRAEMETRQRALWSLEDLKKKPRSKSRDTRPEYKDVKEDFEQLQLRNYALSGAAAEGVALDYALIRDEAAEVKRRATRLKDTLSLPKLEEERRADKGEEAPGPEGLKAAVTSLDAMVNSFVWNPVFQRPDRFDVEQSSKASRDLAGIIRLSEEIRRRAEEVLGGAPKK